MDRLAQAAARCAAAMALAGGLAWGQPPVLDDPSLAVETVATGLDNPTTMGFVGPDDILVLQQHDGKVIRVVSGTPRPTPALDVAVNGDTYRGLLGIAVDTEVPPKVFLYYTEIPDPNGTGAEDPNATPLGNRVYRFTWNAATGRLEDKQLVLDLPTFNADNNGGPLLLGPTPTPGGPALPGDGSVLYVMVGEERQNGQLQNHPSGNPPDDTSVLLRVLQDGSPVPGNPFTPYCSTTTSTTCGQTSDCPGGETCLTQVARYYAYGIRNSFGLARDPVTGRLWDTENGDAEYDEVNRVEAGFNSGWDVLMGPDSRDPEDANQLFQMPGGGSTYRDPEFSWLSTIAPTGIVFPSGSVLGPGYDGAALVGDFNVGQIYRLPLNVGRDGLALTGGLADQVADDTTERDSLRVGADFGPITALTLGPDGALYVLTYFEGTIYRITSRTPTVTPTRTAKPTATVTATGGATATSTPSPSSTSPPATASATATATPAGVLTPSSTRAGVTVLAVVVLLAALLAVAAFPASRRG
jgi:aldose sugar dehydrogenase